MSESSKDSSDLHWGTPESYWPFPRPLAEPEPEDRARFQALTPGQRVEWLVMMLRLLEVQFGHLMKPRSSSEEWLHVPQVKAQLDEALAWAARNPWRETDLNELEEELRKLV